MLPENFRLLLEKFSQGACSPQEEQLIKDWYNSIGQPVVEEPITQDETDQIGESIWSAINPAPARNRWLLLISRAAIISIPLMVGIIFYASRPTSVISPLESQVVTSAPLETKFRNEGSNDQIVYLSDGSEVILEPASEIVVCPDFGNTSRELTLMGEAFFKVKPDIARPFFVHSNEVTTRVLGTSFWVRAYQNDKQITVRVKTGKVSVYASKGASRGIKTRRRTSELILTPNQQMVYNRGDAELLKQVVKKPEIILPNSNLFHMQFDNAEVGKIFDLLQANYGIEIHYDRRLLANCRLTTSMSDEGLYERIEVICKAIGASYTLDNDASITIKSNGC